MLEKLKRRIPDAKDEALLAELIEAAGQAICAYTGRAAVPAALEAAQLEIAAMLFNRMGMEGESAHSEGGVSRTAAALPDDLRAWMNCWRLARTAH